MRSQDELAIEKSRKEEFERKLKEAEENRLKAEVEFKEKEDYYKGKLLELQIQLSNSTEVKMVVLIFND